MHNLSPSNDFALVRLRQWRDRRLRSVAFLFTASKRQFDGVYFIFGLLSLLVRTLDLIEPVHIYVI